MPLIELPEITIKGRPDVNRVLDMYRAAIIAANNLTFSGDVEFTDTGSGYSIHIKPSSGGAFSGRVTTAITVGTSGSVLGKGKAKLYTQTGIDGQNITLGPEVTVLSNMLKSIPVGTEIEVVKSGNGQGYKLVAARCP